MRRIPARMPPAWLCRLLVSLVITACCFGSPLTMHQSVQSEATPNGLSLVLGHVVFFRPTYPVPDALRVRSAPPSAYLWSEDPLPPSAKRSERLLAPGVVIEGVNLTFYDCLSGGFCGRMYNGETVYEGATACSWDLPIGTRFLILGDPSGRTYVCKDRGLLSNTWVDVYFRNPKDGWRWQNAVGRIGSIKIVSVGH